jgi:hypothetical protein
MKALALSVVLPFCFIKVLPAQDNSGKPQIYLGGTIGISSYFERGDGVRVGGPERREGAEIGFNLMYVWPNNFFIKTGVEYTYHQTPFMNDTSIYESFTQIPVFFGGADLWRFSDRTKLTVAAGPRVSVLAERGIAGTEDRTYSMQQNVWGRGFKLGVIGEIAVYHRVSERVLNAYGLRVQNDLPGWSGSIGENGIKPVDRFMMGSFFINVNFLPKKAVRPYGGDPTSNH